jgi:hypothetical protein
MFNYDNIPCKLIHFSTDEKKSFSDTYEAIRELKAGKKVMVTFQIINGRIGTREISDILVNPNRSIVVSTTSMSTYEMANVNKEFKVVPSETLFFVTDDETEEISFEDAKANGFKRVLDLISQNKHIRLVYHVKSGLSKSDIKCTILDLVSIDPETFICENSYGLRMIII